MIARIAELRARRALEAAKSQLEGIIQNQPRSLAAKAAKRMLEAVKPPPADAPAAPASEVEPATFNSPAGTISPRILKDR